MLTNDRQTVLYIGCKSDLAKRVYFHKKRLIPGFSKKYNLQRLVYFEEHPTIERAPKREKSLKGKTRAKKIALIEASNPSWHDLMRRAKPILYEEQGISPNLGRSLNLRAHLGAYIMQIVHGWTDRWTEEMLRFYIPARLFCGFLESTASLDHTRIEAFRNRFGKKGAQLITQDMLKIAQEYGFCGPEDVDMDTTVQEAGITHPTEMKLIDHLMKKAKRFHTKLMAAGKRGIRGMYSEANINRCRRAGIKKIGIQPKGKAKPVVSQRDHQRLKNRRAGIEPRLAHLKT